MSNITRNRNSCCKNIIKHYQLNKILSGEFTLAKGYTRKKIRKTIKDYHEIDLYAFLSLLIIFI